MVFKSLKSQFDHWICNIVLMKAARQRWSPYLPPKDSKKTADYCLTTMNEKWEHYITYLAPGPTLYYIYSCLDQGVFHWSFPSGFGAN